MMMTVLTRMLCTTEPKIYQGGKPGRVNLYDQEQSGCPVIATEFHMRKSDDLIKDKQWITQREIAVKLGISQEMDHIIVL